MFKILLQNELPERISFLFGCFHVHRMFKLRLIHYAPSSRWPDNDRVQLKVRTNSLVPTSSRHVLALKLRHFSTIYFIRVLNESFMLSRCVVKKWILSCSWSCLLWRPKHRPLKESYRERKFLTCRENSHSWKYLQPYLLAVVCATKLFFSASTIISVLNYLEEAAFVLAERKSWKTGCARRSRTWL